MSKAYIVDGMRTPIGRYGGALASLRPDDLGAHVIRALVARHPELPAASIDEVIFGCADQAGEDNRNVARMAALLAGLPVDVPGTTINRLCGSGLDAIGTAARAIKAGEVDLVLAGGVESMTRAPLVMGKAEGAFQRSAEVQDTTIGWRFVDPLLEKLAALPTPFRKGGSVTAGNASGVNDGAAVLLLASEVANVPARRWASELGKGSRCPCGVLELECNHFSAAEPRPPLAKDESDE